MPVWNECTDTLLHVPGNGTNDLRVGLDRERGGL